MAKGDVSARALGYLSIGLGAVQLVAPGPMAKLVGIRYGNKSRVIFRLVGLRELTAGLGLLTQRRAGQWMWARVAGDLTDLALLSAGLASAKNSRERVAAALVAVAGVTYADLQAAEWLTDDSDSVDGLRVTRGITVNRPPEEVYRFWRNFTNFPHFMRHVVAVRVNGERTSHWVAAGPAGKTVEWDAEITDDRVGELLAWRSLPGAGVENSGEVRFSAAPGGRGTEVRVDLQYRPPAGVVGALAARLFGQEPRVQVQADLRRLKQVLETGEVLRSDATQQGAHIFQHAAQPYSERESARSS